MGEYLPLLIGIIWVAYTLYNKGKKKQNVNQPRSAENTERKPLSLFEQILMGEEIKAPQPYDDYFEPVESIPTPQKEKKFNNIRVKKTPSPFLNEELSQFSYEGQSVSDYQQNEMSIYKILTDQDMEIEGNDFDIRKAVIYSEILNPPYIGDKLG